MFMFLSAVGLYYSLNSKEKINIKNFYWRRFIKVFVPYLIVASLWYGIKYIFIEKQISMFLYELSTISFWIEHKGAWYVAALVPIYLIYPFFYMWTEGKKRNIKHVLSVLFVVFLNVIIYRYDNGLYIHLSQVLNGLVTFIIGSYYAEKIKHENNNCYGFIVIFLILFILKKMFISNLSMLIDSLIYSLIGIVMCIVLSFALNMLKCEYFNMFLRWFGKHSLTLYLTNIFILQAMKYFNISLMIQKYFNDYNGYITYTIVVVVGIISTYIIDYIICKYIQRNINTYNQIKR